MGKIFQTTLDFKVISHFSHWLSVLRILKLCCMLPFRASLWVCFLLWCFFFLKKKKPAQSNLLKGFLSTYGLQSIMEKSQDRGPRQEPRDRNWSGEHWGMPPVVWLSQACSTTFPMFSRSRLSHSVWMTHRPSAGGSCSAEISSPQICLGLCQVKI